jgi:hypothetical protein
VASEYFQLCSVERLMAIDAATSRSDSVASLATASALNSGVYRRRAEAAGWATVNAARAEAATSGRTGAATGPASGPVDATGPGRIVVAGAVAGRLALTAGRPARWHR